MKQASLCLLLLLFLSSRASAERGFVVEPRCRQNSPHAQQINEDLSKTLAYLYENMDPENAVQLLSSPIQTLRDCPCILGAAEISHLSQALMTLLQAMLKTDRISEAEDLASFAQPWIQSGPHASPQILTFLEQLPDIGPLYPLQLENPDNLPVLINGRPPPDPILLPEGIYQIAVLLPSENPLVQSVHIPSTQHLLIDIAKATQPTIPLKTFKAPTPLPQPQQRSKIKKALPWIAGGLSLATLGGGIAINILANQDNRKINQGIDRLDRHKTRKAGAIACYSLSGALAVASTLLFIFGNYPPSSGIDEETEAHSW